MNLNNTTTGDLFIIRLENISRYISTCTFLFYLIFGNIGNLFKIFFFLQKPLRCCPCTVYVLIATVSHFFTLNNIPILNLISHDWLFIGFGWKFLSQNETIIENSIFLPSSFSIKMCKIQNYFHMWSSHFSFQLLVFASINRFCMSLKRRNRQQAPRLSDFFCSLSTAYLICTIACIVWAVISLQHLFNFTIIYNICTPENTILWAIELASTYFLQSILMIIFGTLTILYRQDRTIYIRRRCRNHHEMIPIFNQLCQHCRNERSERHHVETQLTSMIITEVILVVLTSLPYSIYIFYRLLTVGNERTFRQMMYENIIERLVRLSIFFEPSCGFYVYLFSLKTLKTRFSNIIRRRLGIL